MCFKCNYIIKPLLLILGMVQLGTAHAEFGVNFPEPAGELAQNIFDIHMLTMSIATILLIIVFAIVIYSIYYHRKSRFGDAHSYAQLSRFITDDVRKHFDEQTLRIDEDNERHDARGDAKRVDAFLRDLWA